MSFLKKLKTTSLPFGKANSGLLKNTPWVRTPRHDHCSGCYKSLEHAHPCLVCLGSGFLKAGGAIWEVCGTSLEEINHWVWTLRFYNSTLLSVYTLLPNCVYNVTRYLPFLLQRLPTRMVSLPEYKGKWTFPKSLLVSNSGYSDEKNKQLTSPTIFLYTAEKDGDWAAFLSTSHWEDQVLIC